MNSPTRALENNSGLWARGLNAALGAWLFISAFIWTHSSAQVTNTWVCGVLAVVFAAIAAWGAPAARYLNTALAVWLFFSSWALYTANTATIWNNVIVSIAMFATSLVPGSARRGHGFGAPRPAH